MANTKKRAKVKGKSKSHILPFCSVLLICEQVIQGKDDVLSAVRIVDILTLPAGGLPEENQNVEMPGLKLLALVKKGDASGKYTFGFASTDPAGVRTAFGAADFSFSGPPESGTNLISPLRIKWAGEGLYWIELTTGGERIAQTPLRIKISESNHNNRDKKS